MSTILLKRVPETRLKRVIVELEEGEGSKVRIRDGDPAVRSRWMELYFTWIAFEVIRLYEQAGAWYLWASNMKNASSSQFNRSMLALCEPARDLLNGGFATVLDHISVTGNYSVVVPSVDSLH